MPKKTCHYDDYRVTLVAGDLVAGDPVSGYLLAGDLIAGDPVAGDPRGHAVTSWPPVAGDSVAGDPKSPRPSRLNQDIPFAETLGGAMDGCHQVASLIETPP